MAFRIKPGESVERAVRRLARSQIDKALASLDDPSPESAVHDARRRFKRLRALLRLAEDGLGRKLAREENARFRDAGRPLSDVRDAEVLVQTMDSLAAGIEGSDRPECVASLREELTRRKEVVSRRVLVEEDTLACIARRLRKARRDAKHWSLDPGGWRALAGGIERMYRRGRRAYHKVKERPLVENLHEWRKRVKDLAYTIEVLEPIRPGFLVTLGDQSRKLADILGDDHDLAVLRLTLMTLGDGVADLATKVELLRLIDRRRAEFLRAAFALAPGIYAEEPDDFVARLRRYWRVWRAAKRSGRGE